MAIFHLVIAGLDFFFDLPLVWTASYTEKHLREEVDFIQVGCGYQLTATSL